MLYITRATWNKIVMVSANVFININGVYT